MEAVLCPSPILGCVGGARVALGAWSLAYGDRGVCVSRVVGCSSLV